MSKKPHWPRGPFTVGKIGDVTRILDRDGNDAMTGPDGPKRLAACANAVRHDVWFPENHVPALEDQCARLEQLRKEAWATAQRLQAEVDRYRAVYGPLPDVVRSAA